MVVPTISHFRAMRRRRPYSHRRQKRFLELLWPFLVIILVGVIVVLLVQFVMAWMDQRQAELKNKVYFYLDEGTAQVLPWGGAEWTKAYNQLVLEGDVIRMGPASRGLLTFFNNTTVRLDADTKVEIKKIESSKDEDTFYLDVEVGRAWFNVADSEDPLRVVVTTDNLRITSFSSIFEVGLTDRETVRVMDGEALVEVVDESNGREIVLDQVKVGVGQQVQVTANDVAKIQSRLPVALLQAVDDAWKETPWYLWNRQEDANPTSRAIATGTGLTKSEPEVSGGSGSTVEEEASPLESEVAPAEAPAGDQSPPVVAVTVPAIKSYTLTDEEANGTYSVRGTAGANVFKVTVISYDADGKASPYVLNHYKMGDGVWRYGVARDFGNLREGRNLFTVVAENEAGVKSPTVEVVLIVKEGSFVEKEEPVADSTESLDATAPDAGTSSETPEESPAVSNESLVAPGVSSLNGAALPSGGRYTSSAEAVTIVGSVGSSAAKVFVNGYQLSKYVAGSGQWSYVVRPDFSNYAVGLNTYTVVAEDAAGNQKSFKFEIYREAP